MFRFLTLLTPCCLLALPLSAQEVEPQIDISEADETSLLRLEELITKQGDFELDLSFALSARSEDGIASTFETISLGGGQFVSIPTTLDPRQVETDTALFAGTSRYGLTEKLELSGFASFAGSDVRAVQAGQQVSSDGSFALNDVGVGLSYQFSEDDETPAIIGFARWTLAEATDPEGDDYAYGRTLNVGLTTYRVIDPLIPTLSVGYRLAAERDVVGQDVDPGDVLYLNPGVAFAVNDQITLTGGVNFQRIFADEIDGAQFGTDRTRAEMEFGVGYGVSRDLTLRANARSEMVGGDGFTLGLSLNYKFGPGR